MLRTYGSQSSGNLNDSSMKIDPSVVLSKQILLASSCFVCAARGHLSTLSYCFIFTVFYFIRFFILINLSLDSTNAHFTRLALDLLNLNYSSLENSVDPDQLASEKPADQDPRCFPCC